MFRDGIREWLASHIDPQILAPIMLSIIVLFMLGGSALWLFKRREYDFLWPIALWTLIGLVLGFWMVVASLAPPSTTPAISMR